MSEYQEALYIRQRLVSQDPTNAGWRRDLVLLYYKVAGICRENSDIAGENEWFQKCHLTLSQMRELGMHLDPPMAELLTQLNQKLLKQD